MEMMMEGLVKEVRMETREPSVLFADESDPWNLCRELRAELEAERLSRRIVEEYRTDIKTYLSGFALAAGIGELRLSDSRSIADTMDLPDGDDDANVDSGSTDILSEPTYSGTAEEVETDLGLSNGGSLSTDKYSNISSKSRHLDVQEQYIRVVSLALIRSPMNRGVKERFCISLRLPPRP
jgi:hypothetical protein